MELRKLDFIEASALLLCNYLAVYSFMNLRFISSFHLSTTACSLGLTLISLYIVNRMKYQKVIYLGALLFLPVVVGKSVIGWGFEFHLTQTENVWIEMKQIMTPLIIRYTLEPLKTDQSSFTVLFISLALITCYLILNSVHVVKLNIHELILRGGTEGTLNGIKDCQINLYLELVTIAMVLTILIIGVSNYTNSVLMLQRIEGFPAMVPGFGGVIIAIVILWIIMHGVLKPLKIKT